jgi:hypothetical protein
MLSAGEDCTEHNLSLLVRIAQFIELLHSVGGDSGVVSFMLNEDIDEHEDVDFEGMRNLEIFL